MPPRTLMRALSLAILLPLLAACASTRSDQAALARTALVGLPKSDLLNCAGAPWRSYLDSGVEYLTYVSQSVDGTYGTSVGLGYGFGSGRTAYGLGFGLPLGTDVRSSYCEATFRIEEGRVSGVNYVGDSGYGGQYSECFSIVESCLLQVGLGRGGR